MNRHLVKISMVIFSIIIWTNTAFSKEIKTYNPTSWDKEAFKILSQIQQSNDYVEKWIKINELSDLFEYITDKRAMAEKLLSLVDDPALEENHTKAKKTQPVWLNERILLATWDLLRITGQFDRADNILKIMNVHNQGYIAGPFENDSGTGMDIQYEAEKSFLLSTDMKGKQSTKVHWRLLPKEVQRIDRINISDFVYPSHNSITYYAIGIKSKKRKGSIRLAISFSESIKIFLNGNLGYEFVGKADKGLDKVYLRLNLKRGTNILLIKVGSNDRESYTLGVHFTGIKSLSLPKWIQITNDPQELRDAALKFMPTKQDESTPFEELPSPVSILEERTIAMDAKIETATQKEEGEEKIKELKAQAATTYFMQAKALFYTKYFDREERRDEKALDEAASLIETPGIELLLWRADIASEAKTRMDALQEAYRQEPFHPLVAVKFASKLWKIGLYSRAIKVLKESLKRHPDNMDINLSYLNYVSAFENSARLWRKMAQLYIKYPANSRIVKAYVFAIEKSNRVQDMLPVRQYWQKLELNPNNLWWLFNQYIQLHHIQAALHILDVIDTLYPFSTNTKINRADLLFGMKKYNEARDIYLNLMSMRPNDPSIIDKFAMFEALVGNKDKATALWRQELKIKPQDAELKERLSSMEAKEDFAKPYIADAKELAEKIKPPDDKNVNSQILLDQHIVKVFKNGLSFRRRQLVVRVLNDEGVKQWQSVWQVFQAARQDIKLKSARILRPGYGEISPLSFKSMPWNSDGKMVYDVWLFVVSLDRLKPGDVFELQLEIDDTAEDNLFHDYFGDLVMVRRTAPVAYFRYVLITDSTKKIYYNKPNFCPQPAIVHKQGQDTYIWLGTNLPYIKTEPLMPGAGELSDPLHISTFSSWQNFAKWYESLIKDQFTPGPRLKKKVQQVTEGALSKQEKLLKLFRFVSTDIKYIALELGVHSYKPYQANQVLERGYGDCKDKATLLISMLKQVDIPANLVILRTRNMGSLGTFPPSLAMFNHAIVYLPTTNTFIDPTVRNSAMEALPWQDQGAQALVLSPDNPRFTTIPYTATTGNMSIDNRTITISTQNSVIYESNGIYKGVFAYSARGQFEDKSHQQSTLDKILNMQSPGAELLDYKIEGINNPQQPIKIYVKAKLTSYIKQQQNKILLPLELSPTNYVGNYASLSKRQTTEVIPYPFCYELNAKFSVPSNYTISSIPEKTEIKSEFGEFVLSCNIDSNTTASCKRTFCLTTLRVPPNKYTSFRNFLEKVDFAGTQNVEVVNAQQH